MARNEAETQSLPLRGAVLLFLSLNLLIAVITAANFLDTHENFHPWFVPVFLSAIGLLICILCFYIWQLPRTLELAKPPAEYAAFLIWLLLVLSVICTSALHKFFPFRSALITLWPRIPPRLNILKYNFFLTVVSLVAIFVLAVLYAFRRRPQAATGLVILAAIMLVPNDNCGNFFNRPWVEWIGASPLMFMPNSVVLLIGYCALHGIWPRVSILMVAAINVGVFMLGLGHLTGVVW